jgi:aminoglycoside 6'-N-acetyltransferase I
MIAVRHPDVAKRSETGLSERSEVVLKEPNVTDGRRDVRIERFSQERLEDWVALRQALWPHATDDELRAEAKAIVARGDRAVAFLARASGHAPVGFAEATLRYDNVNGCTTSPVGFLEGIYVHPDWRRRGIARRLCTAVEAWAARLGCSELASDTELQNSDSQLMHTALEFEETERVIFYRKRLAPSHS